MDNNRPEDKKTAQDYKTFYEQMIPIMAFLGGAIFAGLVFLLQTPSFVQIVEHSPLFSFDFGALPASWYASILETLMASLSIVSIFTCIASASALSFPLKDSAKPRNMYKFVYWSLFTVFFGLVFSASLIVYPYSRDGSVVILAVAVACVTIFHFIRRGLQSGEKVDFIGSS